MLIKQTIEKITLTTPRKKTEKHFKNVRELKDISNTDKETKQTNVLGKKEPLKTDKTENVGDNTKEEDSENFNKNLKDISNKDKETYE